MAGSLLLQPLQFLEFLWRGLLLAGLAAEFSQPRRLLPCLVGPLLRLAGPQMCLVGPLLGNQATWCWFTGTEA